MLGFLTAGCATGGWVANYDDMCNNSSIGLCPKPKITIIYSKSKTKIGCKKDKMGSDDVVMPPTGGVGSIGVASCFGENILNASGRIGFLLMNKWTGDLQ